MYDFETLIKNRKLKYVHGSEDSLDKDVYYVFDSLPSFDACRTFCSADKSENRNIIVVNNGIVTDCFIGTIDEVNNSLFDTYKLHEQDYPLIIEKKVKRDIYMKDIRAVRGILSTLSRTQYRGDIKEALRGSWTLRLDILNNIDFYKINFEHLDKNHNGLDAKKVIAFQLGQTIGLHEGVELYTKSTISLFYEELKPFLYRQEADPGILNSYVDLLCDYLYEIPVIEDNRLVSFDDGRTIDLVHEEVVMDLKNIIFDDFSER